MAWPSKALPRFSYMPMAPLPSFLHLVILTISNTESTAAPPAQKYYIMRMLRIRAIFAAFHFLTTTSSFRHASSREFFQGLLRAHYCCFRKRRFRMKAGQHYLLTAVALTHIITPATAMCHNVSPFTSIVAPLFARYSSRHHTDGRNAHLSVSGGRRARHSPREEGAKMQDAGAIAIAIFDARATIYDTTP